MNFREFLNSTCSCPVGYYDAAPSNYICQLCHYSCETCTSGSQCTSCNINYQRTYNSSTQLCSCSSAFYDDQSNQPCIACPYDCLTCLDASTCLTCLSTRSLDSSNRCVCNSNFFENGTLCEQCPVECTSCNTSSICTACVSPRTLSSTNSCLCVDKFYSVAGTSTCNACHYSCAVCSNDKVNKCLFCDANAKRTLQSSKKCTCDKGYYDTNYTMNCPLCHQACA